jgi:hypothetical protein
MVTRDVRNWFQSTVTLTDVTIEFVLEALVATIEEAGFHRIRHQERERTIVLDAYYGSKVIAFLFGRLVPLGRLLPLGKRLRLTARVTLEDDSCALCLRVVPYMELLDTEEIGMITQDSEERFTDDYFAIVKLNSIVGSLYQRAGMEVPEGLRRLQHKRLALDLVWAVLLYPTDTYGAVKRIHTPLESGPTWSWGAFLVPELWFIYYDAWGVAFMAVSVDITGVLLTAVLWAAFGPFGAVPGLAVLAAARILLGRYGERVHYARHGHWRGEPKNGQ